MSLGFISQSQPVFATRAMSRAAPPLPNVEPLDVISEPELSSVDVAALASQNVPTTKKRKKVRVKFNVKNIFTKNKN
jgi:hypothetical protein